MRTCFHLPAVLTTLANSASPSEVPAAPAAVTSTRSQSGTKQRAAACCRALLLIVHRARGDHSEGAPPFVGKMVVFATSGSRTGAWSQTSAVAPAGGPSMLRGAS